MMEHEDECIRNFARHCHSFYLTSLSPASSAHSSLHQIQSSTSSLDEEKEKMSDLVQMSKNDNARIIIEAFDRICAIDDNTNDDLPNLKNEHKLCAKSHCNLLKECGLFEIDNFTTQKNAATLLQQYTEVRDAMRRKAHKAAMTHRQNSFLEILSRAEQGYVAPSAESCTLSTTTTTSNHTTTTVDGIKATISLLENFVTKYQPKIGSHSFLAGLHKFIHLQLTPKPESNLRKTDPSYVVQWTFRGSVLTEACMPAGADGDEFSYARDALNVLFSFLVLSRNVDIEGGSAEDAAEPMVSFEVHKYVSNATLHRIVNILPNPKVLDARATGSLTVLTDSDGEEVAQRQNVDGYMDESLPFFQSLADYCTVL